MKFSMFLTVVLLICFAFIRCIHGIPQLIEDDDKAFLLDNALRIDGVLADAIQRFKRQAGVSRMNNEVDGNSRSKRDVQSENENHNCFCSPNNGGSSGSGSGTSDCVCNTYPHHTMNNMGSTVYHNVYHICNCGTNPNPNNVMNCCASNSNNNNCNCCTSCQCGCSNGTNFCTCSSSSTSNGCCSTSQSNSKGNVCYTFDKTCCNTQNTKSPPFNNVGLANHHGPVFVYNNYYYYCTCKTNNNIRQPSTCSTTCACGCQPNTTQPPTNTVPVSPTEETRGLKTADRYEEREFKSFDSTVESKVDVVIGSTMHPQIFTNSYAQTKPSISYNRDYNNNLGTSRDTKRDSIKSSGNTYTDTFTKVHTNTPKQSEQTQKPMTQPKTNAYSSHNQNRGATSNNQTRSHNKASIDLSELFRHLKK